MIDIEYVRVLKTPAGYVWGEMTVRGRTFAAAENRSVSGYSSVPGDPKPYQLKMLTTANMQGTRTFRALQFVEVPGLKKEYPRPFLIHPAFVSNPSYLAGCIAPGLGVVGRDSRLLLDSDGAMRQLLELLGPWEEGKDTFYIHICNNAPGDDHVSREGFIRQRAEHLKGR